MYFSPHRLCLLPVLLLVLPWNSDAVPACDVTLCNLPFGQGEAVTCDSGRCYSCPPQLSGDNLYYYRIAFNTTHCAAVCSRVGTREGVAECAEIYDNGPRYCANITSIGFPNSTGTFMDGDGDLYDFVGVCLSCGEGKSPNPSGNGCESAAPSNTTAPAVPAPPRAPSPLQSRRNTTCADVSDCNPPRRLDSASFCFQGECSICSGRPKGNNFVYQVPANSTHCKPACIRPNTSSGITECESIYGSSNALSKGRYYCKSLVDVPGYPTSSSTFLDRFGNTYDFSGICQDCGVGMEPNAAGTGCQMLTSSPAPPPVLPNTNGTCTTVQECSPPEKDSQAAICFLGECGYCPSRQNGPNQFFAVASDKSYCKPACMSPGTGIGMLECNTIYSNAVKYRGSFYCEFLLNITGYSANSSTYLDSTGKAYSFAGVCLLCDPDNNRMPDHTGSRCVDKALSPLSGSLAGAPGPLLSGGGHMSPPESPPVRLPPLELPRSLPKPPGPPSLLSSNQTLDREAPPVGNATAPDPSASSSATLQDFTTWGLALLAATATIIGARW